MNTYWQEKKFKYSATFFGALYNLIIGSVCKKLTGILQALSHAIDGH